MNCVLHRQIYLKKNKKKKYFDFDKYYNPNKQVKNQLFKTNFFAMSTIVIKKKLIIDNGGFSELFQNAQDYDLWLRIGNGFRILIINSTVPILIWKCAYENLSFLLLKIGGVLELNG